MLCNASRLISPDSASPASYIVRAQLRSGILGAGRECSLSDVEPAQLSVSFFPSFRAVCLLVFLNLFPGEFSFHSVTCEHMSAVPCLSLVLIPFHASLLSLRRGSVSQLPVGALTRIFPRCSSLPHASLFPPEDFLSLF